MITDIKQSLSETADRLAQRLNKSDIKLGEARQVLALLKSTLGLLSNFEFKSMLATETLTHFYLANLIPPIRVEDLYRTYLRHCMNSNISPFDISTFKAMALEYFDLEHGLYLKKRQSQKLISG
jgi:hypothetical protein